jgi:hypothetical protein
MRLESYDLEFDDTLMTFEFISKGPKGTIRKRVLFQTIDYKRKLYNLAFGDVNEVTNNIDDSVATNNNDTDKVLGTVAKSVLIFLEKHPNIQIYAEGSTLARTRLYQIGISKNLEEINDKFYILGFQNDSKWVPFEKNCTYSAFLIFKKNT